MRDVYEAIKLAMLFIGTVVGAGFATGREIRLFFGNCNFFGVLTSALIMALLAALFLTIGQKQCLKNKRVAFVYDWILTICSLVVFAAMLAGAEELFVNATGIPFLGWLTAGAAVALAAGNMELAKKANLVIVPALTAVVIAVCVKAGDNSLVYGTFQPFKAMGYAAMNILFSAGLMTECGKTVNTRQTVLTSAFVFAVLGGILTAMWLTVRAEAAAELPFTEMARAAGAEWTAVVLVALAIFTTLLSCAKLSADKLKVYLPRSTKCEILLGIFLIGAAVGQIGFAQLVDATYPIIAVVGGCVCACAFIFLIIQLKFAKKMTKLFF